MQRHSELPRSLNAHISVAISAPLIAWLSVTMLSGSLFQGNGLVTSATLSTVATAIGLGIAIFGCFAATPRQGSHPIKADDSTKYLSVWRIGEPIGLAVLVLCSLLACLPAAKGMPGLVVPCMFGCLAGAGLGLSFIGSAVRLARQHFQTTYVCLFTSMLIGGIFFLDMNFLFQKN